MTRDAFQRVLVLISVAVLLAPAAGRAQTEVGSPSPRRPTAGGEALAESPADHAGPSGSSAMFASAAYPGLGQLLNDAEPKAAVVSAVEAFLVANVVVEDRRTRNALRLYKQTGEERYYDEYSEHFDRRQTLIWWAAAAALYGLADAYVDALLTGFDDSSAVRIESSMGADGDGGIRLGIAFGF